MNVKTKGFALELADLLEKHSICITAPNTDPENKIFSYVNFIARGRSESLMPKLQRCHVSSYDLRCETGMSSSEANELYQSNKQVNKGEFVPKANKPVYTQAMCDKNELPPIDSNYLDEDGQLCRAIFHYSSFVIGEMLEHIQLKQYPNLSTSRNDRVKSLTPPIKLIDGEAYQFDYCSHTHNGVYGSNMKRLYHINGFISASVCTNIKLLTVKREE